jgi:hypothetical protein
VACCDGEQGGTRIQEILPGWYVRLCFFIFWLAWVKNVHQASQQALAEQPFEYCEIA